MNNYILFLKQILTIGLLMLMGGCANLQLQNSSSSQKWANDKSCKQADVLITDLTKNPSSRTYMLADGKICPNVVTEQA